MSAVHGSDNEGGGCVGADGAQMCHPWVLSEPGRLGIRHPDAPGRGRLLGLDPATQGRSRRRPLAGRAVADEDVRRPSVS